MTDTSNFMKFAVFRGFQEINPHDNTPEKIAAAGKKQLQNMQGALDQRIRVAKQRSDDLDATIKKRDQNRREVHDFNTQVKDKLFNLEISSQAQRIKVDIAKAEKKEQALNQLLAFTQTGAKFLGERQKERQEAQKSLYRGAVDKYGLDGNSVSILNGTKEGVKDLTKAQIAEKNRLRAAGMPEHLIEQVSGGLPLYLNVAIKERTALLRAQQLPIYLKQYGDTPLKLGDQTFSYNSAFASGDPVKFFAAKRSISLFLDNELGPIEHKVKETSGSLIVSDAVWAQQYREFSINAAAVAKQKQSEIIKPIFDNQLNQQKINPETNKPVDGTTISATAAYLKTIDLLAGGEGASKEERNHRRDELNLHIINSLTSGDGTYLEVVKELINGPGEKMFNGAVNNVGDQWPQTLVQFEKAIESYASHRHKESQTQARILEANKVDSYVEASNILYNSDTVPSTDELIKLYEGYKKLGHERAAQLISNHIAKASSGENDMATLLQTKAIAARYDHFPLDYQKQINIKDPVIKAKVNKIIANHNKLIPTTGDGGTANELSTFVDGELERALKGGTPSNAAKNYAKRKVYQLYTQYVYEHGELAHTNGTAVNFAKDQFLKQFNTSEGGEYEAGINPRTNKRDFLKWRIQDTGDLSDNLQGNVEAEAKAIQKDNSYLQTHPVLNEAALRNKMSNLNPSGNVPGFDTRLYEAEKLQGWTGIPAIIIEAQQIEYYNKNRKPDQLPIPQHPKWYIDNWKKETSNMDPKALKYLTMLDPTRINAAYMGKGAPMPYISPTINKVSNIVKANLTDNWGGYNNIDNGKHDFKSSDLIKDVNIINATLSQVERLVDPEDRVGAYKLTPELIRKYAPKAGLTMQSKFNKINQDKLFEVIYRDQGVDYIIDQLGRLLIDGSTFTPEDDLNFILESYEALKSDKFEVSQWRTLPFMHTNIAKVYQTMMMETANA